MFECLFLRMQPNSFQGTVRFPNETIFRTLRSKKKNNIPFILFSSSTENLGSMCFLELFLHFTSVVSCHSSATWRAVCSASVWSTFWRSNSLVRQRVTGYRIAKSSQALRLITMGTLSRLQASTEYWQHETLMSTPAFWQIRFTISSYLIDHLEVCPWDTSL